MAFDHPLKIKHTSKDQIKASSISTMAYDHPLQIKHTSKDQICLHYFTSRYQQNRPNKKHQSMCMLQN